LENSIYNLAKTYQTPAVLIMDRGLMDSAGYMSKESWELLKQMTGWSNVELRDERYDAILHMITAADGAP